MRLIIEARLADGDSDTVYDGEGVLAVVLLKTDPLFRLAEQAADSSAINVVHLIYKNKPYEGHYKDYEFSIDTMQEHRESGLDDIRDSFAHREWFDVPSREQGFVTHDVHRRLGSVPQSDRDMPE